MQDEHVVQCILVAALHLHALRDFCVHYYQSFQNPSSILVRQIGASTTVNTTVEFNVQACSSSAFVTGVGHRGCTS